MWPYGAAAVASLGWIVAAAESSEPLWQYGAVGIGLALALVALRTLFKQHVDTLAGQLDRERARADRLEDEIRKQNQLIQDRILTALADFTRAAQEAMQLVKERR